MKTFKSVAAAAAARPPASSGVPTRNYTFNLETRSLPLLHPTTLAPCHFSRFERWKSNGAPGLIVQFLRREPDALRGRSVEIAYSIKMRLGWSLILLQGASRDGTSEGGKERCPSLSIDVTSLTTR